MNGRIYHGEEGIQAFLEDERREIIEHAWQQYLASCDKNGNAGDYRWLAAITKAMSAQEFAEPVAEIVRVQQKHNPRQDEPKVDRRNAHKQQILRLWDVFKAHDTRKQYDSRSFREALAVCFPEWDAEQIRRLIRERDKAAGEKPSIEAAATHEAVSPETVFLDHPGFEVTTNYSLPSRDGKRGPVDVAIMVGTSRLIEEAAKEDISSEEPTGEK